MKVKLIGVFDEKLEDSDDTEVNTDYYLKNVIAKEDFDNGEIEGISYCGKKFFYMREDLNFMIDGEHYDLSLNEDTRTNNPRKEELELLDSLEEGDVITFDVDLFFEFRDGKYYLSSLDSSLYVDNIEKYEDRYAADKLEYLAEKQPSFYDEIDIPYPIDIN